MAKKASSTAGSPGPEHRVVLLSGDNTFLAQEYTAALRERLESTLGKDGVETVGFDADAPGASAAEILDECRSFGLMQQHKLVIVDNAAAFVKDDRRPIVERYVQAPSESATLVLRAPKWYKGKLDDMIADAPGIIIDCGAVSEALAVRWAINRASKRHQAELSEDAAVALVDLLGPELGRIDAELGKLAAAASAGIGTAPASTKQPIGTPTPAATALPRPVISKATIAALVGKSREETSWEWQEVLLSARVEPSLSQLRDLLNVSRQPSQLVWWAVLDLTRKLGVVSRSLKAGQNPEAVARSLKLWGPSKDPILSIARQLSPEAARHAFKSAVEGDRRSKTGLGESERSLELLTVRLSGLLDSRGSSARAHTQ